MAKRVICFVLGDKRGNILAGRDGKGRSVHTTSYRQALRLFQEGGRPVTEDERLLEDPRCKAGDICKKHNLVKRRLKAPPLSESKAATALPPRVRASVDVLSDAMGRQRRISRSLRRE